MAKNDNSGLGKAKRQKKDEFYTRLEDIERELAHYKAQSTVPSSSQKRRRSGSRSDRGIVL